MTIFIAASDETKGTLFLHGGFVAPEEQWKDCFEPAWQERVLTTLPYLHMTQIRSAAWRRQYEISESEAERRVDEALRVINSTGCLHPISSQVGGSHFREAFTEILLAGDGVSPRPMQPDYLCFPMFAFHVLGFVSREYPEARRVNFVIERPDKPIKGGLEAQQARIASTMKQLGNDTLARLVGDFSFGDKVRIPLQAADVLCWHARRRHFGLRSPTDGRRLNMLARLNGVRHVWTDSEITAFAEAAKREHQKKPPPRRPGSSKRRSRSRVRRHRP